MAVDRLPQDQEAARAAIQSAFLNHTTLGEDGRSLPLVHGGENLGPTLTVARRVRDQFIPEGTKLALVVEDVDFIDASHAEVWFATTADGRPLVGRSRGHAVLVDGVWKMSRSTFCDLMSRAGITCPSPGQPYVPEAREDVADDASPTGSQKHLPAAESPRPFSEVELEHHKLRADLNKVRADGEAHTDWVSVKFENDPPIRVVVLFSGDRVAEHAAALRALVAHPDRLDVRWSTWSLAHLELIRSEVRELFVTRPGQVKGLGIGWGIVHVSLRADQERLASQLLARYGDAVSLILGAFPYPPDRPRTSRDKMVEDAIATPVPAREAMRVPGLELSLELDAVTVVAGQDGTGRIVLCNVGDTRVDLSSEQPLTGDVVDPRSEQIVARYTGLIAGTGLRIALAPGEVTQIILLFSTASTRLELGYTVPPGQYLVHTSVPVHDHGIRRVLPVPPASLVIVEGEK
jgi:hypothetical protein